MKILVVGATGLIGGTVAEALSQKHEIIEAGFSDGDVKVDLGSKDSISAMYKSIGPVDAVVCTAGLAGFAPFSDLDDAAYDLALSNKLMGQVNLVRVGQEYINEGGSFTLTAGILSREPMHGSVVISLANGALESFARAAALEMVRDLRVNTVSPVFVKETMQKMGIDPSSGLSAVDTAKAYVVAVEGGMNGETLDTPDYA